MYCSGKCFIARIKRKNAYVVEQLQTLQQHTYLQMNQMPPGKKMKNQQYFSKSLGMFSEYMVKLIKTELAAFMDKTRIFIRIIRQMRRKKRRDQLK